MVPNTTSYGILRHGSCWSRIPRRRASETRPKTEPKHALRLSPSPCSPLATRRAWGRAGRRRLQILACDTAQGFGRRPDHRQRAREASLGRNELRVLKQLRSSHPEPSSRRSRPSDLTGRARQFVRRAGFQAQPSSWSRPSRIRDMRVIRPGLLRCPSIDRIAHKSEPRSAR